ncbi:hypothetical protein LEP1GSC088_3645 [Leptospira interrogans str. L1207]|nr:hypothetical protein LEP1GSC088_3645 [Leptospira interrogans str. L1207]
MHLYIFPIIATIFFFVSSSLFGENLKIDFNLLKYKINKGSKSEVLKIFNEIKQTNRLKIFIKSISIKMVNWI